MQLLYLKNCSLYTSRQNHTYSTKNTLFITALGRSQIRITPSASWGHDYSNTCAALEELNKTVKGKTSHLELCHTLKEVSGTPLQM